MSRSQIRKQILSGKSVFALTGDGYTHLLIFASGIYKADRFVICIKNMRVANGHLLVIYESDDSTEAELSQTIDVYLALAIKETLQNYYSQKL